MNTYQPPLPADEAGRRLHAYPALVAACQAAYPWLQGIKGPARTKEILLALLKDALAAAEEYAAPEVDIEYEARLADVGLHGENAEPEPHEWTQVRRGDALA